jgi:DNA-binding GntR family transcriptional regulator
MRCPRVAGEAVVIFGCLGILAALVMSTIALIISSNRTTTTVDDPVIVCPFKLRGTDSHQPWALGLASYPLDAFNDATRTLLLNSGFVDDDELERVSGRRLVGYHERIRARLPTPDEADRLDLPATAPVLTLARTARTTTTPITRLSVTARPDRLEVDYLIEP